MCHRNASQNTNRPFIYNKIESNFNLSNKKNLFLNMKTYYESTGEDINKHMPLTFLVTGGVKDSSFMVFKDYFQKATQNNENNQWILKPGEFSNRGKGIKLTQKLQTIEKYVESRD